jgi:hypothetical protein
MTGKPIMESPTKLPEAWSRVGFQEKTFDICGLGEARLF